MKEIKEVKTNKTEIKEQKKLQRKEKVKAGIKKAFFFAMRHTVIVISICLVLYAISYIPDLKSGLKNFQIKSLKLHVFAQAILFFVITLKVFKFLKTFISDRLLSHSTIDPGIRYSIAVLIGYLGWIVAGWGVLSIFGINMDKLTMVLGALSVGLGFGLQHIVNNFFSGVLILFERPIKKGDWVIVNGQEGIVTNIKIRSTELKTFDETSVVIPNADILSNSLVNMTHTDMLGRVVIHVGVSYDSDLHKVKQILLDCGKKNPARQPDRDPIVFLTEFGDSSINFDLVVVISDVMSRKRVHSEIMFDIYDAFAKEGVEIPFPQRVVHIKENK